MPEDGPLSKLAKGFRGRTLGMARLATRMVASRAGRRLFSTKLSAEEVAAQVDEEDAIEAATSMLETLDGMKGVMLKLGQMASYLSTSMPPKAQRVLARLQSECRGMDYESISGIVAAELGAPPEELFDSFEREPFAAASIGQVHRARWEGRELAVKVQYPEVEDLIRHDLGTIRKLSKVALLISPLDGNALSDELAGRFLEECDYRLEARNQRLMSSLLEGRPGVSVPEVVASRSARRVLSSEFVDRRSFAEFAANASQEARNRAGLAIFSSCFGSIFEHCVYNADPHPGNYLFDDEGRVTLLDFGCLKRFDADMIDKWKELALSYRAGDRARFKNALHECGIVAKPKKFDYDAQWEIMGYLYRPLLATEPFAYTAEYVRESFDVLLFKNPNKFSSTMPADWLFVNRLQWGLNSVLSHLGARALWSEPFWAGVESPTRPVALEAGNPPASSGV